MALSERGREKNCVQRKPFIRLFYLEIMKYDIENNTRNVKMCQLAYHMAQEHIFNVVI